MDAAPIVDVEFIIVDRPGIYVVAITMGTARADVCLVAFPPEALSMIASPSS